MRTKLTTLIAACAVLATAGLAHAGPIPVAVYQFATQGDVDAFQSASNGAKCTRKLRGMTMAVSVGSGTTACPMQTSVVADSSDVAPDQIITATTTMPGGSAKLAKRAYTGIFLRHNDTSGYELRVFSGKAKWQVLRDPKGSAAQTVLAAGTGKFIKAGNKPNSLSLKAFDFGGGETSLVAAINGRNVVSTTDSGMDQPDGRRNGISVGAKTGSGSGITGIFDNVTIQVPNPF